KVNAALKAQLDKLWHTTSIYYTEPILEYAQKLTSKFPSHMKLLSSIVSHPAQHVCFFTNSGSEANDLALTWPGFIQDDLMCFLCVTDITE
ncbi:hypothetical protein OSTOST_24380, partial [Ostertagia ostertagi]